MAGLVLVGTNLGRSGQAALEAGGRWAAEAGATLVACHVLTSRPPAHLPHLEPSLGASLGLAQRRAAAAAMVGEQLASAAPSASVARVLVREGGPCAALLAAAAELGASLLVVGAEVGAGLSPVVADVLRSAQLPVLLARACDGRGGVLACTDLTQGGLPVVRAAVDVACRRGTALLAVHVVPPLFVASEEAPAGDAWQVREEVAAELLSEALAHLEVPGRFEVRRGPVAEALLAAAEPCPDLVVVGRPSGHGPLHHGAVARTLAATMRAPVLMVPV